MISLHKSTDGPPALTGILLAAGQGSRFDPSGQKNKLFELLPTGKSVLLTSYLAMKPYVDQVIIVTSHAMDQVRTLFADKAAHIVHSPHAELGMGASIACGVQHTYPTLGWIVALGDMPYIKTNTYQALRDQALVRQSIVRPRYANQPGHPVFFPAGFKEQLVALDTETGARQLVKQNHNQVHYIETEDAGVCLDIDYPADLQR